MFRHLRTLVIYGALALAVLAIVFMAGFLQEFTKDSLGDAIVAAGHSVPLQDPRIEISLQRMTLDLFEDDTLIKRYDIGFGRGPVGRLVPGQGSTPLGEYHIVAKQKRVDVMNRGSRFLIFDFPSEEDAYRGLAGDLIDRSEFGRIVEAHRLGLPPPVDTALGGPLGIHGNFFFFMQRRFTDGSVALGNSEMNELFEHISIGTRVVIKAE